MASDHMDALVEFLTAPATKMFLSIVAGYPLAFIYRTIFVRTKATYQHIYFLLCGLAIAYINFGTNTIHSFLSIIINYLLICLLGGSKMSVVLAFLFNMGYLLTGYYFNSNLDYSVTWTTPQCVLCLRLIGLVYDIYDGVQEFSSLSQEQKENCLPYKPSLLQMLGYSYFYGGFLVGPQFSMRRYMEMVDGIYIPDKFTSSMLYNVFSDMFLGFFYIILYQGTHSYFPDTILLSDFFDSSGFFFKCLIIMVWAKFMLYKYLGCWNIAEGSCKLTGLGYIPVKPEIPVVHRVDATGMNPEDVRDENGEKLGDNVTPVRLCPDICSNVKGYDFEVACTCHELVLSFNINTNKWMARYVFKRCKSLGNRHFSHIITLAFLALWHGFYSGYYVNFMVEFFVVKFEHDLSRVPQVKRLVSRLESLGSVGQTILYVVKKVHLQMILSYALVGFALFTYPRYMQVYSGVYHFIFITHFIMWPLIHHFILPKEHKQP